MSSELGQMPGIHLEYQKDLWWRKGEWKQKSHEEGENKDEREEHDTFFFNA